MRRPCAPWCAACSIEHPGGFSRPGVFWLQFDVNQETGMGTIRLGNKPPLTVAPEATVLEAIAAMTDRRVGALTVLDGRDIMGVFSERDLMQRVVLAGLDPRATRVRQVMSSPALTVPVDTTVEEAASLMREHHIRHLCVVNHRGELVGMLALRYLLYDLLDQMERKVTDLEGFVMADGPGG
jgi:CBS domain-containing protein